MSADARAWLHRWNGEPFAYVDDRSTLDVWHLSGQWFGRILPSSSGNIYDEQGRYVGTVLEPRIARHTTRPPRAFDVNLVGSWDKIERPDDRAETYDLPDRIPASAFPRGFAEVRTPRR